MAGKKGDHARRRINREMCLFLHFGFGDRDAHGLRDMFRNWPLIREVERTVSLAELECLYRAVTGANDLVDWRYCCPRCCRRVIEPVTPAKAVKSPTSLLEEGE